MTTKQEYTRLEHADPTNTEWFVVNWCLGNTCNFSCSYCPAILHDGSKRWPEFEDIKRFILKVKEQHPTKKLYFEFTGGEVTMYKHFIALCEFCREHNVKVGMISNGSRTLRWWEENKHFFDHVCLSFHPEEAKADHFLAVAGILHDIVKVHVNVMMSPEKFDDCYALAERAVTLSNISLALQPLIHDFGDKLYDYTDEQKSIFDRQYALLGSKIKHTKRQKVYRGSMRTVGEVSKVLSAHSFIANGTNNWFGWDCYAGVEQLIVDMDGSIHRGWCKVGDRIGYIWDANLQLPTAPVRCNKIMCHCNYDIMSTKERA
jgi:hypothetical protein